MSLLFFCIFLSIIHPSFTDDLTSSKERISYHILNKQEQDPFNLLSEEDLQKEWSFETDGTLLSKIDKLTHTFEEFLQVNVYLVGFEDSNVNLTKVAITITHILSCSSLT